MSRFIRFLSGSPWTHVALCVGRLEEYTQNADPALRHPTLRHLIARASHGDPKEPVLIEALLGRGTVLTPLRRYRAHAVKICRPRNLSAQQMGRVIRFAVRHLGFDYDLRQILDLVRLAVPLPSFARRWRSTLFDPDYVASRRCICSTLLVQSFTSVAYPVVAVAAPHGNAAYKASLETNPRLATPRDFEGSPYFRIYRVSTKWPGGRTGKAGPAVAIVTDEGSADTGRRQTVCPSWSISRPSLAAMRAIPLIRGTTCAAGDRDRHKRPPVCLPGKQGCLQASRAGAIK